MPLPADVANEYFTMGLFIGIIFGSLGGLGLCVLLALAVLAERKKEVE